MLVLLTQLDTDLSSYSNSIKEGDVYFICDKNTGENHKVVIQGVMRIYLSLKSIDISSEY